MAYGLKGLEVTECVLRVRRLDSSMKRKPDAHHQSGHGGDARRLSRRIYAYRGAYP